MRTATRPVGAEQAPQSPPPEHNGREATLKFGIVAALTTTVLTVVSFGLALTALPNHVPYPFTGDVIAAQWPGDYLWMYPAMLLMLAFVAQMIAVHQLSSPRDQVWTLAGLCAAVLAAGVLLINYFVQVTVLQPNLQKEQLDGWSMLTQYNPNGLFIALEELGYLLMALALLCVVPALGTGSRAERSLRWLFTACFTGCVAALAIVSAVRGIDRADVFEIAVICLVWSTLIVAGPLLATVFRRSRVRVS